MKLLFLSDIHGNLDALHAIRESYDELWVLGDIVNYGPEPREALEGRGVHRRPEGAGFAISVATAAPAA